MTVSQTEEIEVRGVPVKKKDIQLQLPLASKIYMYVCMYVRTYVCIQTKLAYSKLYIII